MSKDRKKKMIDIEINIDTKEKFFKIVDYDNNFNGGAISGGYKNKKHFIDIFTDYFDKYISIDCYESENYSGTKL